VLKTQYSEDKNIRCPLDGQATISHQNQFGVMPNRHIAVMGIKGLPAKGGGERVAEAIIKEALAADYRVSLYAKCSYYENDNIPDNLRIVLIRDFKGKHLSAFFFGLFSCIHALLFNNYDLIHLHYADFGYIVPLLRLRYKVISTSHGAEYNRDKWGKLAKLCFKLFEVPFIKYSNICTSVSASLTGYYQKKYHKKIIYIANGVNLQEANNYPYGELAKYDLLPNQYMLFCAGRIIPSKGCDTLLQANRLLQLNMPLVVIGNMESDPYYKEHLLNLAERNVKFIDFISCKRELFGIIANCRFFIFPSTYEAMSMMLLEVAALKKGIVCSDIPENHEAIGENAIYFQSGLVDSLCDKIEFALKNSNKMAEIGEKAYHWIEENRDWKKLTKSYLKLYDTLLSEVHT
jgi:glycosyltransferase involved in cell wall biosynthesis